MDHLKPSYNSHYLLAIFLRSHWMRTFMLFVATSMNIFEDRVEFISIFGNIVAIYVCMLFAYKIIVLVERQNLFNYSDFQFIKLN